MTNVMNTNTMHTVTDMFMNVVRANKACCFDGKTVKNASIVHIITATARKLTDTQLDTSCTRTSHTAVSLNQGASHNLIKLNIWLYLNAT